LGNIISIGGHDGKQSKITADAKSLRFKHQHGDGKKNRGGGSGGRGKISVNAIIAIVDTGGHLVYLERFDKAQFGSIDVAIHKARCSVAYKRPTKAFEEEVKSGKISLLTLYGILCG
jgi:hypothetical protein